MSVRRSWTVCNCFHGPLQGDGFSEFLLLLLRIGHKRAHFSQLCARLSKLRADLFDLGHQTLHFSLQGLHVTDCSRWSLVQQGCKFFTNPSCSAPPKLSRAVIVVIPRVVSTPVSVVFVARTASEVAGFQGRFALHIAPSATTGGNFHIKVESKEEASKSANQLHCISPTEASCDGLARGNIAAWLTQQLNHWFPRLDEQGPVHGCELPWVSA